jgi:MFS transporter, DHA2 family, multidrug resistance protein
MEVLDTSIANVALPHIAGDPEQHQSGNLGAHQVGAWASSVIGRRNFFLLCITILLIH